MGRWFRRFIFACTGTYLLGSGATAGAMDAGIPRPRYAQIADGLVALAHAVPGWATAIDYGVTPEGRPLRALRIEDPNNALKHDRPAVLITGSTHGDEYLHIEDRLGGWFLSHRDGRGGVARFLAAGGVLLIVPVVNPDGFAAGTRHNSHDVDLNRDFGRPLERVAGFEEPESRALAQWLAAEVTSRDLELRMTLDYHCCSGALLYPKTLSEGSANSPEGRIFAAIGPLVQEAMDRSYSYGSTQKVLGYAAYGTSKDYFRETYGALSFTFEGRYHSEARRFAQHTLWWDRVLELLAHSAL